VPAKWAMQRLGILESALARPPLAPLSQAGAARAELILAAEPVAR
jgi:dihydrodipicolinate synthase/N-acetylneuraminate lyase